MDGGVEWHWLGSHVVGPRMCGGDAAGHYAARTGWSAQISGWFPTLHFKTNVTHVGV
jgi:hypothetical protein